MKFAWTAGRCNPRGMPRWGTWVLLATAAACSGERTHTGEAVAAPTTPADASVAGATDAAAPADAGVAVGAIVPCHGDDDDLLPAPHDTLTLTKATYKDLPGWGQDKPAEALPSFLRSCTQLATLKDNEPIGHDGHGGIARQWRRACKLAAKVPAGNDAAAQKFFESEFVPWQAAGKSGPDGKMTAYDVQELRASRKKHGKYQHPIYGRPADLVMVDLSKFIRDSHGRRISGRFDAKTGDLVPFYTRKEIRLGALAGRKLELMYVDEPIDLLFAHIEGSAKAKMDDGTVVWLDYAGKNGRSYRGVGEILKSLGAFKTPGSGTMQGIRKWFEDNRPRWNEVVDQVASFVFFQEAKNDGPLGSQMVVLIPKRSLAIDRAFIAQSTPIWVDTRAPIANKKGTTPWRQLVIAQDTGGGIKGAVRGDIYWGDDAAAAEVAGRLGGKGRYWLLLPKGVTK